MSAKAGRNMLLSYTPGGGSLTALGGLRSRRMRMGREPVDVTTADSASLHRVLLEGGGVFSMSISGDGVFEDSAAQGALEAAVRAGTPLAITLTIPDYGTYTGSFVVPDNEFGGDHNAELTFSATLESAGLITFTPAA